MATKNKEAILADLVKEKTAAGLRPEQALECAKRQIEHDDALAADEAEKEAAAEKKKGAKGGKPDGDGAKT